MRTLNFCYCYFNVFDQSEYYGRSTYSRQPSYFSFTGRPIVNNNCLHCSSKNILYFYLLVHSSFFPPCLGAHLGRSAKANCNSWVYKIGMGPIEKSTSILNKIFILGGIFFILLHLYVCTHWVQLFNEFSIPIRLKRLNA